MLLFVLLAALSGAALISVTSRVLPSPFDAAGGVLGLVAAAAGPALMAPRAPVAELIYAGAGALFLALVLRAIYEFVLAASDAKVREIVRNAPRRVPSL